jgi:hypothetical protein
MSGKYYNVGILTALYIECAGITFQICVVYERGSFLWIASDNYKNELPKVFGDTARAINK